MKSFAAIATMAAVATAKDCTGKCQSGINYDSLMLKKGFMAEKAQSFAECFLPGGVCGKDHKSVKGNRVNCADGKVTVNGEDFPCKATDFLSFIALKDLRPANWPSVGNANDIWGWTDPVTAKEYAMICLVDGTSFVDVSDPINPVVLGFLPDRDDRTTSWRDAKVYDNHVFIGSENMNSEIQIYDLTKLRDAVPIEGDVPLIDNKSTGTRWNQLSAEYLGQLGRGSSHNVVINEDSGYMYVVGAAVCRGGLHMVDINEPKNPKFAGCFDADGYTHDAECVIYDGPDEAFTGREICFAYNEDSLTVVDVTDHSDPKQISRIPYAQSQYTHQGWLTSDRKHLLLNDELDEQRETWDNFPGSPRRGSTRTMVWNVENLAAPYLASSFFSSETAIDHNLYIRKGNQGDIGYLSNYSAGLRVMNATVVGEEERVSELGYFDVCPDRSTVEFVGTWSNYPFYTNQGLVAVSSIERGLFMLESQF